MKIKLIIGLAVAAIVGYWVYGKMFVGKNYEKGEAVNVAVKDLAGYLANNKEKYDGKRVTFEGYLGYDNTSFSASSSVRTSSNIMADKVYNIGVFNDVPETEMSNKFIDITLPQTKGTNGFSINKSNTFTNDDITYTTNDKVNITYKDKVQISATVKYYCNDNFNTKQKECSTENPITKKQDFFYYLVNVRIDKK
jgi:hypothetical protein